MSATSRCSEPCAECSCDRDKPAALVCRAPCWPRTLSLQYSNRPLHVGQFDTYFDWPRKRRIPRAQDCFAVHNTASFRSIGVYLSARLQKTLDRSWLRLGHCLHRRTFPPGCEVIAAGEHDSVARNSSNDWRLPYRAASHDDGRPTLPDHKNIL